MRSLTFERSTMRSEYVVGGATPPAIQLRQEWFRKYEVLGNARATCLHFGVSRKTFYKWLRRFKQSGGNPASLADLPRTPHHSPRKTPDEIRGWVLAIRTTTGFGPRRLRRELKETKGVQLSERTIWKIVRGNQPRVESQSSLRPATYVTTISRIPVSA